MLNDISFERKGKLLVSWMSRVCGNTFAMLSKSNNNHRTIKIMIIHSTKIETQRHHAKRRPTCLVQVLCFSFGSSNSECLVIIAGKSVLYGHVCDCDCVFIPCNELEFDPWQTFTNIVMLHIIWMVGI